LEVPEAGSWTELNEAHRDLRAASRTPSGLANNYGVIPDAFPAAVELTGLGALSDAPSAESSTTSQVPSMKKLLLFGTDEQVSKYISAWRQSAVDAVCEAFTIVESAEREFFGAKPFFNRLDEGHRSPLPDDDPDPAEPGSGLVVAHGFERSGRQGEEENGGAAERIEDVESGDLGSDE
jgi:hypothetical protein